MDTQSGYLLVVEDIPDILKLLDATLKFKGYRVLTARNGEEALEVIQKERPLMIITDILMPKMDGFSLVHTLRIHSETRSIPVIFLSATYVAPEDKAFALNIGATRFIEKPIDLELFMKTISELLLQGAPASQEPLTEPDFYIGYRKRLKTKLNQKMTQIARTERLLETLPEEEKPSFQASLQMAISEREEIEKLLDQIRENFETK
ncbi:MAG TPA: response regulator [Anaerolineales bacterium]|nr:response regulator [Anaerolineales bacterium]